MNIRLAAPEDFPVLYDLGKNSPIENRELPSNCIRSARKYYAPKDVQVFMDGRILKAMEPLFHSWSRLDSLRGINTFGWTRNHRF